MRILTLIIMSLSLTLSYGQTSKTDDYKETKNKIRKDGTSFYYAESNCYDTNLTLEQRKQKALDDIYEQLQFSITESCKNNGVSPEDLTIDFSIIKNGISETIESSEDGVKVFGYVPKENVTPKKTGNLYYVDITPVKGGESTSIGQTRKINEFQPEQVIKEISTENTGESSVKIVPNADTLMIPERAIALTETTPETNTSTSLMSSLITGESIDQPSNNIIVKNENTSNLIIKEATIASGDNSRIPTTTEPTISTVANSNTSMNAEPTISTVFGATEPIMTVANSNTSMNAEPTVSTVIGATEPTMTVVNSNIPMNAEPTISTVIGATEPTMTVANSNISMNAEPTISTLIGTTEPTVTATSFTTSMTAESSMTGANSNITIEPSVSGTTEPTMTVANSNIAMNAEPSFPTVFDTTEPTVTATNFTTPMTVESSITGAGSNTPKETVTPIKEATITTTVVNTLETESIITITNTVQTPTIDETTITALETSKNNELSSEIIEDKPAIAVVTGITQSGGKFDNVKIDNDILQGILQYRTYREVGRYIHEQSNNKPISYSDGVNIDNPSKAYFVLFDNRGYLTDILNTGSKSVRESLITGKQVNYKKNTNKKISIFIYD